jgi:hypothetical protein
MSLKQLFLALVLGSVLIQAGLTCAKAEPPYEISLEDEFGNHLPTYAHRGEWFAQGRDGQRYNVRVTNHSGRRVEAVVTVDGRDVLTGQPGDFKHQRGYLVPAYGSVLIEGFRTSLSEVAAFRFTNPDDSYSARMGTPENVGVIGAAFFPEVPPPAPVYRPQIPSRPYPTYGSPQHRESSSSGRGNDAPNGLGSGSGRGEAKGSAPAAESAPAPRSRSSARDSVADDQASNIGTEYGERTYSEVSEVPFERAHPRSPASVLLLRYDDHEGLVARGILPRPAPRRPRGPSAFPVNRFAPPPPYSYWQ